MVAAAAQGKRPWVTLHVTQGRYVDPVTGQRIEKSARTTKKREADKRAGEWQAELLSTGGARSRITSWADFRDEFFEDYIDHNSDGYGNNVSATFNMIEQVMRPDKLTRITTVWIKRFRTKTVKAGKSAATVHKYLQHLRTALNWAVDQDYLKTVPKFPAQDRKAAKKKKHMKGRPITGEEFDRMVEACFIDSQEYLLNGLWVSGLRIGEALALTWDQWEDGIRIQIDDDGEVCLLIDAEDQKNRKTETYPVVDEFAAFLLQTPESERQGHVFNVCGPKGIVSRRVDTVSDWLVAIGEKAGVKVDQKQDGTPVFASAHDLRRAFGDRWAKIVPPMILKDLMRHASVTTTEQHYVSVNAKSTMEQLRKFQKAAEVPLEVPPEVSVTPKR